MTHRDAGLARLVRAEHGDPHTLLGPQLEDGEALVRVLAPEASEVVLMVAGARKPMKRKRHDGLFEIGTDRRLGATEYELSIDGATTHDPYAFMSTIGELDLHLIAEGRHDELYTVLGAQPGTHQGVEGTAFAVWAPNSRRVSVVGDFNSWDGRRHAMRKLGPGVWEIFVPALEPGASYKYELWAHDGAVLLKADPCGQAMSLRPSNVSRVASSDYVFNDSVYREQRASSSPAREPMSIYEVHLGSWRRPDSAVGERPWFDYRELAVQLVDYVADLGFTHIELLPIMEHPLDASWGYQVSGYYAPTSRYGSGDDLRFFIDCCHEAGLGVILDWVPAHFPRDDFALGRFDGTALYEHLDPRLGEHRQWGTYIFNYGRAEVRNFLIANARYWVDAFHVDGLRCDAVASLLYLDYGAELPHEWLPNRRGGRENLEAIDFVRALNDSLHTSYPGVVTIAEESTAWSGVTRSTETSGLGFDFKWNMGWMHDTLDYFAKEPVHRSHHHNLITFGLTYAFSERFVLPLSHDEVVHLKRSLLAKMPGDRWQQFANLRALYAHMWAHPGKKLLFMGGELGVWDEWSEERALDWSLLRGEEHAGLQQLVRDLNRIYVRCSPLYTADADAFGFEWIDCNDNSQSIIAFMRFTDPPPRDTEPDERDHLVCIANFTPVVRHHYRVGVLRSGRYREVLNTDAHVYGGSGVGNLGVIEASETPCHGLPCSVALTLPPLAVLWLVPEESGSVCHPRDKRRA